MAAKLLHSLADDNPDLQKQIGCMTGIFQLFDRQHVLTSRRLSQKRLTPGDSHFMNGSLESFNAYNHHTSAETSLNKSLNEKQRLSTESSRASFESSCSSSLSSIDCNKPAQPEASSFDRVLFLETPSRDPIMTQPSTSPHIGRQSLDLRDVVKDSMYREARGLLVKTPTREEAMGHLVKHKDSPRPLQLGKPADGTYGVGNKGKQNVPADLNEYGVGNKGKQNVPADLNESLRVLAKLREAPWYCGEARERPRSSYDTKDGSWHTISKDAPRFSYEGREMNRLSFESRDTIRSIPKLKEMPRLSLDSREISMRGSNSDSKSNYLHQDLQNISYSNGRISNVEQSSQKRPPSVVAKLMGLEALPDSTSTSGSQSGLVKTSMVEQGDGFSKSFKPNDLNRSIRTPRSPRSSLKESTSPRWKNPDLIMKPISKLPIEAAPWKQQEGSRSSQKLGFMPSKVPAKTQNSFPSVYSEIERRLKDIEFKQSRKDLRALKQILEAMQSKGLLESGKEEQVSSLRTQRDYEPRCTSPSPKSRLLSQQNPQINQVGVLRGRDSDSLRMYESPIVIMKPTKLVDKTGIPASSVVQIDGLSGSHRIPVGGHADGRKVSINNKKAKDQSPRIDSTVNSIDKKTAIRNTKSTQSSSRTQQMAKENTSSVKNSGSVSPRLQQKKLELEKRSRPPTPPSDSNRIRRQSNKQQTESGSPGGKYRLKTPKVAQSDDQLSQISNDSRTSSHQGDDASVQSDSTAVYDLKTDMEVTSVEQFTEINGSQSPLTNPTNFLVPGSLQKSPSSRYEEDGTLAELAVAAPEHPSPVSVLDASIYRDDLSPVKQIPNVTRAEAQDSSNRHSDNQWKATEDFLSDGVGSGFVSEINRKKLQNIENLVQKLRRLNSTHDEASTDYIASLCENTNPDHRYISEILLASGLLLRDLSSGLTAFQLHPSGQPINPELFLVLEQTKASQLPSREESSPGRAPYSKPNPEKFHRKLIFDTVNEVLFKKLASVGPPSEPWLRTGKLAKKTIGAQKLLKELCTEIEQFQIQKSVCSLEEEDDGLKGILWDDVMHRSESWTDFHKELSSIVLDVERLVFKDLVDEIVLGGGAGLLTKPGRRRQLFAK